MSAAWMVAGAAVAATGALLNSAGGPARERAAAPKEGSDRSVSPSAISDALAAVRRVEQVSGTVCGLEKRIEAIETNCVPGHVEVLWQRAQKLEEDLEQVTAGGPQTPALEMLSEHVENLLSPRMDCLEAQIDKQRSAIQSLQAQAFEMETNLQRMITAVVRLADRILGACAVARPDGKEELQGGEENPPFTLANTDPGKFFS